MPVSGDLWDGNDPFQMVRMLSCLWGEPKKRLLLPNELRSAFRLAYPGWDNVLCGGLDAERMYLVEGEPGTGKTTLALQFLLEGARLGEKCLYVTLSESERELRLVAKRHGFSLDQLFIFELVPPEASLDPERELTLFIQQNWSCQKQPNSFLIASMKSSHRASYSIACPKCASWRKTRYGIAVMFWLSNIFSQVVAARCFCWTIFHRRRAIFNSTASRTG